MAIAVEGYGVVSPAGWGMESFRRGLQADQPVPPRSLSRPGSDEKIPVRQVPPPNPRPSFLAHPRFRRTSAISHYALAAALEALQAEPGVVSQNHSNLGIIFCTMSGCVNYSKRFYEEALKDPATASPLVFPETVFNAPASHLASFLGSNGMNYTLVGDPGTFLQGLSLAAQWLEEKRVERCLVVAAEEMDWLTANAFRLFERQIILSDGAGALLLSLREEPALRLDEVTDSFLFSPHQSRLDAARKMKQALMKNGGHGILSDGLQNLRQADAPEQEIWRDWPGVRLSVKKKFGEGLMAGGAWQCIAALDALNENLSNEALVSVVGCNQQAIGARFRKTI